MLIGHGLDPNDPVSLLLIDGRATYSDSEAILRVVSRFGGPWRLAGLFRLIPRGLRDSAYRWLARNRYRWFGRRKVCMVPSPEVSDRFIR